MRERHPRFWIATAFASVAFALTMPAFAASGGTESAVHHIDVTIHRPDEGPLLLGFEIQAGSESRARALAESLTGERAPGTSPNDSNPTGLSAAWLPWSWSWDLSEIPVEVAYNPTGAPAAVGPSAIIAGLQAWSSVPDSSFRFHYAGVTNNVASILESGPDGENVISWAALPCEQGCVLGVTSRQSAHEVDMLLNSNPAAADQLGVGDRVDWRTVILHELGHMAGLEHSCPVPFGPCSAAEAAAVMYFQYRGKLRKLAPDDAQGLASIYPLAPAPTATPTPSGPIPSPTQNPTAVPELVVLIEPGWNLVVLPAGRVEPVAERLHCIDALYSWQAEGWHAWIRGLPAALQSITSLEPGRAYWAHASQSCADIFP